MPARAGVAPDELDTPEPELDPEPGLAPPELDPEPELEPDATAPPEPPPPPSASAPAWLGTPVSPPEKTPFSRDDPQAPTDPASAREAQRAMRARMLRDYGRAATNHASMTQFLCGTVRDEPDLPT